MYSLVADSEVYSFCQPMNNLVADIEVFSFCLIVSSCVTDGELFSFSYHVKFCVTSSELFSFCHCVNFSVIDMCFLSVTLWAAVSQIVRYFILPVSLYCSNAIFLLLSIFSMSSLKNSKASYLIILGTSVTVLSLSHCEKCVRKIIKYLLSVCHFVCNVCHKWEGIISLSGVCEECVLWMTKCHLSVQHFVRNVCYSQDSVFLLFVICEECVLQMRKCQHSITLVAIYITVHKVSSFYQSLCEKRVHVMSLNFHCILLITIQQVTRIHLFW